MSSLLPLPLFLLPKSQESSEIASSTLRIQHKMWLNLCNYNKVVKTWWIKIRNVFHSGQNIKATTDSALSKDSFLFFFFLEIGKLFSNRQIIF